MLVSNSTIFKETQNQANADNNVRAEHSKSLALAVHVLSVLETAAAETARLSRHAAECLEKDLLPDNDMFSFFDRINREFALAFPASFEDEAERYYPEDTRDLEYDPDIDPVRDRYRVDLVQLRRLSRDNNLVPEFRLQVQEMYSKVLAAVECMIGIWEPLFKGSHFEWEDVQKLSTAISLRASERDCAAIYYESKLMYRSCEIELEQLNSVSPNSDAQTAIKSSEMAEVTLPDLADEPG